jgi:DNA polymerase epsilon subunit 1
MVRNTGLDLTKLDRSTSMSRQKYLDGGRAGKYLFLYHAFASGAGVHCFVLILSDGAMKLHIVDRSARRQPISRLEEAYQDLLEKRRNSHGKPVAMDYPSAVTPTYNYHGNETTALKALSRELGLLEGRGHTVVLSSMKEQSFFDTAVPKLDRFPVLSMPKTKTVHILDLFPWTTNVAQKLFSRYLSAGAWLDRSMALADYYQVPIGHLEADQPLFLSDLEFARRLVAEDMLLWWSPGDRPDLGGLEDDYRMTEEFPNTEFTSPGCYFNVCLEIAVRNLAVDAVLHSVVINELEGAGGATAFDSTSHMINEYAGGEAQRDLTLGESQVSPKMFSILRSMVKTWMVDKIKGNFESAANVAVDHFWRWVSSSAAQMYDPSIHRFVHGLMRKTFIQLLAEFRRLGSHVVYADLSRILLVTSKPPGTAHAYATYITTAVTANELFQHVYLNTERFYDFLLFMDPANLGGIVCEDPLAVETPEQLSMEMKWNIQTFLPPAIQNDFASAIRYFVIEMFRTRQRNGGNTRVPLRILQNGAPDATQADTAKTKEMDSFREFISRKLARKLLKIVGNVQERHRDTLIHGLGDPADWEFPLLPGSHLNFSNPVLELMKSICAALLLANDYTVELGLVRRSVLELVGVREFSQDAVFVNPCEPLRLANVPCRHCDSMQDFDFCRDPTLLPGQREVAPRWTCGSCGGEYDRTAIELALIGRVHDLERRFAQQDLRCAKCGQIRSDNLSRHCQCSGAYQLTVNKAEARRKLRTMVNVAIVHNLARLRVSVSWTLSAICTYHPIILQECAQVLLEDWS